MLNWKFSHQWPCMTFKWPQRSKLTSDHQNLYFIGFLDPKNNCYFSPFWSKGWKNIYLVYFRPLESLCKTNCKCFFVYYNLTKNIVCKNPWGRHVGPGPWSIKDGVWYFDKILNSFSKCWLGFARYFDFESQTLCYQMKYQLQCFSNLLQLFMN